MSLESSKQTFYSLLFGLLIVLALLSHDAIMAADAHGASARAAISNHHNDVSDSNANLFAKSLPSHVRLVDGLHGCTMVRIAAFAKSFNADPLARITPDGILSPRLTTLSSDSPISFDSEKSITSSKVRRALFQVYRI